MSLFIGQHLISPPIFLAPMAGITDLPFRRAVSSFKTGHFVSEMIASQEILSGRQGVRQKAELGVDTANTSVQISGRDPYAISETAKLVEGLGAKIIDISFDVLSEIPKANSKGGYAAIEAFVALHDLLKKDENSFDPRVAVRIKRGEQMTAREYIELMNARRTICETSNKITRNFDALLMPTVPVIAPILKDLENSDDFYHQMNLLMLLILRMKR